MNENDVSSNASIECETDVNNSETNTDLEQTNSDLRINESTNVVSSAGATTNDVLPVDDDTKKEVFEMNGSQVNGFCIRVGCCKLAVDSPHWDHEYCSSECAIKHCKSVFEEFVKRNKDEVESLIDLS